MATISDSAEHATEHVRDAASHARARFFDFSTQVLKLVNGIREAQGRGTDTVLDHLGLRRQKGPLGPALWFAAGAVTAGAAVFLLTPTSGGDLRRRIARFFATEGEAVVAKTGAAEQRVDGAVMHAPNGAKP
jgi:hypothetical protein